MVVIDLMQLNFQNYLTNIISYFFNLASIAPLAVKN